MKFKVGDRVIDTDGITGTIVKADSIHNIIVQYDKEYIGNGMYCMNKKCVEYDELKIIKE